MKGILYILIYQVVALVTLTSNLYAQTVSDDIQHVTTISGEVEAPLRIAVDEAGYIYVADAFTKSISRYDVSGNFLETIHGVEEPVSVAVNREGELFIGDGMSGFIYRYDPLVGATEFYTGTQYPSSMVFSQDHILYVADSKLKEVVGLDLSGNVVQTFGSGILDFPTGIAVDENNSRILVGEHGGAGTGFSPVVKVNMFDLQGNLIGSFGSHGSTDGKFYRVQGLTIGRCGNIYVVDPYQSRISVFDVNGVFITKFGDFGILPGELNIPMDIAFDSQERLLVTSMNNGSIELFSISDSLPSSNIRSGNAMICAGESTDIEVAFTGTAPWNFTYTNDGLNPVTIGTADNPFTLTVTDAGHYEIIALSDANYSGTCFTGSADVVVTNTLPTAQMRGDAAICYGETTEIAVDFTGTAPWSYTYTIDGANLTVVTTTNNPHIIEVSEAGLYTGSGLIGGGCPGASFTGSADITVNQLPTATITNGNGQIFIDPDESVDLSVELTGTPPWEYTYTINALSPVRVSNISTGLSTIMAKDPGTYEIAEVTDSNCTSTVSLGFPDILLNSPASLPSSQMDGGDFSVCPGESVPISVLFTGDAPWTFTYAVDTILSTTIYNTYSNPYTINAIYKGTYEIIALSDRGYPGTEFTGNAVVSLSPIPVPDFDFTPNYLEVSFNNISTDADSYFWDFGDGHTSVETDPVHQYDSAGEYVINLTGSNGLCGDVTISKNISIQTVSVESLDFNDLLKIYPNPSNGMVYIEIDKNENSEVTLEIIDINGKIVYSDVFQPGSFVGNMNLASFSSGLYFVRIVSKDYFGVKKLILSTN